MLGGWELSSANGYSVVRCASVLPGAWDISLEHELLNEFDVASSSAQFGAFELSAERLLSLRGEMLRVLAGQVLHKEWRYSIDLAEQGGQFLLQFGLDSEVLTSGSQTVCRAAIARGSMSVGLVFATDLTCIRQMVHGAQ